MDPSLVEHVTDAVRTIKKQLEHTLESINSLSIFIAENVSEHDEGDDDGSSVHCLDEFNDIPFRQEGIILYIINA